MLWKEGEKGVDRFDCRRIAVFGSDGVVEAHSRIARRRKAGHHVLGAFLFACDKAAAVDPHDKGKGLRFVGVLRKIEVEFVRRNARGVGKIALHADAGAELIVAFGEGEGGLVDGAAPQLFCGKTGEHFKRKEQIHRPRSQKAAKHDERDEQGRHQSDSSERS